MTCHINKDHSERFSRTKQLREEAIPRRRFSTPPPPPPTHRVKTIPHVATFTNKHSHRSIKVNVRPMTLYKSFFPKQISLLSCSVFVCVPFGSTFYKTMVVTSLVFILAWILLSLVFFSSENCYLVKSLPMW